MRFSLVIPLVAVLPLALAGCGNSTPLPSSAPATAPASNGPAASTHAAPAAVASAPAAGAFAEIDAAMLQRPARATANCNLDAVDGKQAGSAPVPHAGSAVFSGWAGDTVTGTVPKDVQLVLVGARDYAVTTPTGQPRGDVAAAQQLAAFATSGYVVKANLAAVPPGDYGVTLLYSVAGQALRCATTVKLSVQ